MSDPRKSQGKPRGLRLPSLLGHAMTALGGFALALALLWSPAGRPILERLAGAGIGGPAETAPAHDDDSHEGSWTCGWHPQVIEKAPGFCPICQMGLVPVRGGNGVSLEPGKLVSGEGGEILFYRNPMDPTVTSQVPMKDSMGMDYVPVFADDVKVGGSGVISIDPRVVQNMGVVTERVTRRDVQRHIRTVGYLGYDQERMVTITTKYTGFVEEVYVNFIGQPVNAGDPLFEIFSPELLQTEQELLSAIKFSRRMQNAPEEVRKRADELVVAARSRLDYWDIAGEQVERLESTGRVFRTLTVTSPVSGVIMKRANALQGMAVRPGMDVIHIADLSSLWLSVEVFEHQLAWLEPGSAASISFTYFPGENFSGRVRFVEPEVSEETRTVKFTLEMPNPDGKLRSGMYATVEFDPVIARNALTVPTQAILRTGTRNVAVVALGGGKFDARQVRLGPLGEGWVQVLDGLDEGDQVVTSSQFLFDSESNLREAIQKLIAGKEGS